MQFPVSGTIRYTSQDGTWFLRFIGDVRVTSCVGFDTLIESIFADPALKLVMVDLSEASNLDSTTLGLLAKLALRSEQKLGLCPALWCKDKSLLELLTKMGMTPLFHRLQSCQLPADCSGEVSESSNPDSICSAVLEAHRILVELNASNADAFRDVITAVEQDRLQSRA